METETLLILAAFVFLVAGTIKGLVGLGLPTAVVAMLAQFTDPREVIALLLLPILISNTWQIYRGRQFFKKCLERFWLFGLVMCVLIFIFTQFAASFSAPVLTVIVGSVIIIFVLTNFFTKTLIIPDKHDKFAQIFLGSLAGIMGGITSLWAPPLVIYLFSKRLPKDEFVAAIGLLLMAGCIPLLAGYLTAGLTSPSQLLYSLTMVVPTLIGFSIGERLRKLLDADQFKNLLLLIFFLLGVNLIRSVIF